MNVSKLRCWAQVQQRKNEGHNNSRESDTVQNSYVGSIMKIKCQKSCKPQ